MRTPAFVLFLIGTLAAPATAQGIATSFNELRLLVRPGDRVTVVDEAGRETSGRISALSPSAITLLVNRQPREFQEPEVARIRQRRGDPLGNGALWGLGIGAGFALALVIAEPPNEEDVGWAALAVGLYGAMGAGIGVGVDALITRPSLIYERSATKTVSWGIGAAAGRGAVSVGIGFRF